MCHTTGTTPLPTIYQDMKLFLPALGKPSRWALLTKQTGLLDSALRNRQGITFTTALLFFSRCKVSKEGRAMTLATQIRIALDFSLPTRDGFTLLKEE